MKIKYFVRGVGIGMIVTAIILGISYQSKMSDKEIIARAMKLGMDFVDEEQSPAPSEEPSVEPSQAPSEEPSEESSQAPSEEPSKEPAAEPSEIPSEEPVQQTTKAPKKIIKAVLTINRGDWSRIVSERLQELGIIDNSDEFDQYLVDNGYAQKILVGEFELSSDSSYKEIAEAITD